MMTELHTVYNQYRSIYNLTKQMDCVIYDGDDFVEFTFKHKTASVLYKFEGFKLAVDFMGLHYNTPTVSLPATCAGTVEDVMELLQIQEQLKTAALRVNLLKMNAKLTSNSSYGR